VKVMILDDDEALRWILSALARDCGLEPLEACTTQQADRVQASADVMVVDFNLPDGSGLEWMQRRRDLGDVRPAIIISGMTPSDHWRTRLSLVAWLLKPFGNDEFKAALRMAARMSRHVDTMIEETDRIRAWTQRVGAMP
jgi:two-component system OmpR family response regulator